jgi:hypothetical protein
MLRWIVPGLLMILAALSGLARESNGQPPQPVEHMTSRVNEARCYLVGTPIAIDVRGLPPGQSVLASALDTVGVHRREDSRGRARLTLLAPNSTPLGHPVIVLLLAVSSFNITSLTNQGNHLAVLLGNREGCRAFGQANAELRPPRRCTPSFQASSPAR